MSEDEILAKLHDLAMPSISSWPWAYGWYGLFVLAFVLGLFFCFLGYRWYLHGRAKREALRLLKAYQKDYALGPKNPVAAAIFVSELLRRVALAYFPATEVAGLEGEAWVQFLTAKSKHLDFSPWHFMLTDLPYRKHEEVLVHQSLAPLFQLTRKWIKERDKPCFN